MKKSRVLLMLVAGTAIAMFCSRSAWAQPAEAYLNFNASDRSDSSGNGHDGPAGGSYVAAPSGFGMAHDVSAGGPFPLGDPTGFAGRGDAAGGGANPASITMRYNSTGSNEGVLVSFHDGAGTRFHIAQRTKTGISDRLRFEYGGGAGQSYDTPDNTVVNGTWQTVVATQNSTTGWTVRVQDDGGGPVSLPMYNSGTTTPNNTPQFTNFMSSNSVEIGSLSPFGGGINFNGLIDDFAFFNYELNQAQINRIFAGNLESVADGSFIPEPSTVGLLLIGGMSLITWRRRRG